MPLLNKEIAENYVKKLTYAYSKKCSILGMRLKFIGCMLKFF